MPTDAQDAGALAERLELEISDRKRTAVRSGGLWFSDDELALAAAALRAAQQPKSQGAVCSSCNGTNAYGGEPCPDCRGTLLDNPASQPAATAGGEAVREGYARIHREQLARPRLEPDDPFTTPDQAARPGDRENYKPDPNSPLERLARMAEEEGGSKY